MSENKNIKTITVTRLIPSKTQNPRYLSGVYKFNYTIPFYIIYEIPKSFNFIYESNIWFIYKDSKMKCNKCDTFISILGKNNTSNVIDSFIAWFNCDDNLQTYFPEQMRSILKDKNNYKLTG